MQKHNDIKYCIRCNTVLTPENWTFYDKPNRSNYICMVCRKKQKRLQYEKYRDKQSKDDIERRQMKKQFVVDLYGGICMQCGESNIEYLTIDHINNDGAEHRRNAGPNIYHLIYEEKIPIDGYQLLCYNCNCAKTVDYSGYPYKLEDSYYEQGKCACCNKLIHCTRSTRKYCIDCKALKGKYASKNHDISMKKGAIDHYGSVCSNCGESRLEKLTIDHIKNDGAEQRRRFNCGTGQTFYRWLAKNNFPDNLGLQVLCYNCNCSKH